MDKIAAILLFLALFLALASCSSIPSIGEKDSLTDEELHLLEMRGKENSPSIFDIESLEQKTLLEAYSRFINPGSPGTDKLVVELERTARRHRGMGIAAVQIGIPVRLVLIRRTSDGTGRFQAMFNPIVTKVSAKHVASWEYCLSVPWGYRFTYRPEAVTVKFQTADGKETEETFQGDEAIVLQQEADHLHGILLSDGYPKEWFIPSDEINSFARAILHECQPLGMEQCEHLMKLRWEERGNVLRQTQSD